MRNEKLQKRQTSKTHATGKRHRMVKKSAAARVVKAADVLHRTLAANRSVRIVPAKWRWHHRVLLSLQNRLLRQRGDLLRAAAEPLESHSLDEADSATDEFDHDLALTRLSAEQDALYEVNEALERIVTGSYGRCEETGRAIPDARLRAVPWTRFVREVEERLEKQGVLHHARLGKAATVRANGQIWLAPVEEAEDIEEAPPAPAKDEALSHVFSPPGPNASRQRNSKRSSKEARRKGRNT
jgi:RNA polymerase-binding transcription factor DksA